MGEEKVTSEGGEAVANGTMSPTKSNNDVSEKKDEKKEGVEETQDEVKDKNEEVNVDQKDAKVSKDDKEEEKEVTDCKEEGDDERKEEAKSDAMEVDDEQRDDKVAENADSEEGGSKNHATKKSGGEKGKNKKEIEEKKKNDEPKTPVGPTIDRPVRERKSVERLVAIIDQDTSKEFHVEKGRGTALKDIPNGKVLNLLLHLSFHSDVAILVCIILRDLLNIALRDMGYN
ncbi:putative protein DEK [Helianthus annuus]|nr:putative protein DEK [Helianthus annuus]